MKVCDLTQFYSPLSGGVKRYLHEKIGFVQRHRPGDEHLLIVPGAKDGVISADQSRIYTIRSPLVSRTSRYRALLNLRALGEIIEHERPDIIESADPYQVGWAALNAGKLRGIPVVAFYHSHFAEAYLRGPAARFGQGAAELVMKAARGYTRNLYNRFETTFVPSQPLADVLQSWGVRNTRVAGLGVNTEIFRPADDRDSTRETLGVSSERTLLLYVGRLAPEKNTRTLLTAFAQLTEKFPDRYHLLGIGDGTEREELKRLAAIAGHVTWIPYCADSAELAQYYRAADLFVHPGVEETFGLVALESQACGTPVVGIRG
ncbi:MAG: glycosyltransferase, partial [Verrucomicrobiota bacterium]|nr:glycosyltransferase [Verrucomicrobiota bacterium]